MFKKVAVLLSVLCILVSCDQEKKVHLLEAEVDELFALMQGSFNSEKQALADSSYFNISLHMYPIWEDKGNFLYVEQAMNSMQDRPYRQRIYEVKRINDSTIVSNVYTIPNDSLWIGKWQSPASFDQLNLEDLELREGCGVLLQRIDKNHYKGETGKQSCESTLRGATYATSEVEIWLDKIISWDRGFDASDIQVWGAVKGGYIFDKLD